MAEGIDLNEAARYMGVRGRADERSLELLAWAAERMTRIGEPRHLLARVPLKREGWELDAGGVRLPGESAGKLLQGCGEAFLLAATLGATADEAIRARGLLHMGEGLALNACAAAMLEGYLDRVCGKLAEDLKKDGLYITPRFSPGYGDLPLEVQKDFLHRIRASRIGLYALESSMLAPEKSVTAIMGVTRQPQSACIHRCAQCGHDACPFRSGEAAQNTPAERAARGRSGGPSKGKDENNEPV